MSVPMVTYNEVRHVVELAHRLGPEVDAEAVRVLGKSVRVAFVPASRKRRSRPGDKTDGNGDVVNEQGEIVLEWILGAAIYFDDTGAGPVPDGTMCFMAEDLLPCLKPFPDYDPQNAAEQFMILQDKINERRDPDFAGLGPSRNVAGSSLNNARLGAAPRAPSPPR